MFEFDGLHYEIDAPGYRSDWQIFLPHGPCVVATACLEGYPPTPKSVAEVTPDAAKPYVQARLVPFPLAKSAEPASKFDLNRASGVTDEVIQVLEDQYSYHPWSEEQTQKGAKVRHALQDAALIIIANVPPGPDRSAALRKLREARMDANSAITHGGKY